MDLSRLLCSCLCLILLSTTGVLSIQVSLSSSTSPAVLGNSYFLYCQYALHGTESFLGITLLRKRSDDADYVPIVTFQQPGSSHNATYSDTSLETRTVAINPTNELHRATFEFNEVKCSDKAAYRWDVLYNKGVFVTQPELTSIDVKAKTSFKTDGSLTYATDVNYKEGDDITFTCNGDVGSLPTGWMTWYYYISSAETNVTTDANQNSSVPNTSACTSTRTSTLTLRLEKEFNGFKVRCTVNQDTLTSEGDEHIQTQPIAVQYAPRVNPISTLPKYEVGTSEVTLTCSADGNPLLISYSWVLADNSEQDGPTLKLQNLQLDMTGDYTCVASNEINGQNYTANRTVTISVVETTTTSTTTPNPSTTVPGPTADPVVDPDDGMSTTTIVIIVVCVVGGVLIIVIVVIVYCRYFKRKRPEIEEPPEKPRNNQDLSFYGGNRPDLVSTDMKNTGHGLNASFNNSFDSSESKPRNEDLMYVDLAFDDKPRSRRPVQLLDTSSLGSGTPYADIALPHV